MKKLLFVLLLSGCAFVSSLQSARVERLDVGTVRVTSLVAGLLTIASSDVITRVYGADIGACSLEATYRGQATGMICKNVKAGFVVGLETVGNVLARVTEAR